MGASGLLSWFVVGLLWAHIVAIFGWVGSSLYFMWLDSKLRPPTPPRDDVFGEAWMGHGGGFYIVQKRRIAAGQVPSPIYWFRVEAAVTWVTGFLLLVFVYYWSGGLDLIDPTDSPLSPIGAVGVAIALLPICWIVYDRLWVAGFAERYPARANAISLVLLFALIYLLCELFTGRSAFIHVGAVLGTNMVASVWTRIIPAQEEAVAATKAGRERNSVLAMRAKRRATHNTYLTLPVLFTMIATHTPATYSPPFNWFILTLVIALGIAARHLMILFDRRERSGLRWIAGGGPMAAALVVLGLLVIPSRGVSTSTRHVPFTVVRGIIDLRCTSCHSRNPSNNVVGAAPNGLRFDTVQEIVTHAPEIKASALVTHTMPPHNATHMTTEERSLLGIWVDQGAQAN